MKLRLLLSAALLAPLLAFVSPAEAAPAHDDQITRLYQTVLGRTPDPEGLAYWSARRVNGESLEDLTTAFLKFPEVELRSSGDLVVDAYRNALGREPDQAGYEFWASLDPVKAVLAISESLETQLRTGTLPPPGSTNSDDSSVTANDIAFTGGDRVAQVPPNWVDAGNGVYLPPILVRIRFCESTDNYLAANRWSSARGAYQFLTSSWAAYGHDVRYGVTQAHLATPAQQDEAALITWQEDGTGPWRASIRCWG